MNKEEQNLNNAENPKLFVVIFSLFILKNSNMENQFKNDTERIQELKTCLEKSHNLLHNADKMEDVYDMVRTLIRDTLSRYNEDKKFLTADVKREGSFEFLDE